MVERAHVTGMMYEFSAPGAYDGLARNAEDERVALKELGEKIRWQWSWQWQSPFEADWNEAMTNYEESLASNNK